MRLSLAAALALALPFAEAVLHVNVYHTAEKELTPPISIVEGPKKVTAGALMQATFAALYGPSQMTNDPLAVLHTWEKNRSNVTFKHANAADILGLSNDAIFMLSDSAFQEYCEAVLRMYVSNAETITRQKAAELETKLGGTKDLKDPVIYNFAQDIMTKMSDEAAYIVNRLAEARKAAHTVDVRPLHVFPLIFDKNCKLVPEDIAWAFDVKPTHEILSLLDGKQKLGDLLESFGTIQSDAFVLHRNLPKALCKSLHFKLFIHDAVNYALEGQFSVQNDACLLEESDALEVPQLPESNKHVLVSAPKMTTLSNGLIATIPFNEVSSVISAEPLYDGIDFDNITTLKGARVIELSSAPKAQPVIASVPVVEKPKIKTSGSLQPQARKTVLNMIDKPDSHGNPVTLLSNRQLYFAPNSDYKIKVTGNVVFDQGQDVDYFTKRNSEFDDGLTLMSPINEQGSPSAQTPASPVPTSNNLKIFDTLSAAPKATENAASAESGSHSDSESSESGSHSTIDEDQKRKSKAANKKKALPFRPWPEMKLSQIYIEPKTVPDALPRAIIFDAPRSPLTVPEPAVASPSSPHLAKQTSQLDLHDMLHFSPRASLHAPNVFGINSSVGITNTHAEPAEDDEIGYAEFEDMLQPAVLTKSKKSSRNEKPMFDDILFDLEVPAVKKDKKQRNKIFSDLESSPVEKDKKKTEKKKIDFSAYDYDALIDEPPKAEETLDIGSNSDEIVAQVVTFKQNEAKDTAKVNQKHKKSSEETFDASLLVDLEDTQQEDGTSATTPASELQFNGMDLSKIKGIYLSQADLINLFKNSGNQNAGSSLAPNSAAPSGSVPLSRKQLKDMKKQTKEHLRSLEKARKKNTPVVLMPPNGAFGPTNPGYMPFGAYQPVQYSQHAPPTASSFAQTAPTQPQSNLAGLADTFTNSVVITDDQKLIRLNTSVIKPSTAQELYMAALANTIVAGDNQTPAQPTGMWEPSSNTGLFSGNVAHGSDFGLYTSIPQATTASHTTNNSAHSHQQPAFVTPTAQSTAFSAPLNTSQSSPNQSIGQPSAQAHVLTSTSTLPISSSLSHSTHELPTHQSRQDETGLTPMVISSVKDQGISSQVSPVSSDTMPTADTSCPDLSTAGFSSNINPTTADKSKAIGATPSSDVPPQQQTIQNANE